jgi:hypothetical protein
LEIALLGRREEAGRKLLPAKQGAAHLPWHLVAVLGDQDVVLDADAAEAEHALGAVPIDGVAIVSSSVVEDRQVE